MIELIHFGKTDSKEVQSLVNEFSKRAQRFHKLSCSAISVKIAASMSTAEVKRKEYETFLKEYPEVNNFILLDEGGKQFDSRGFSKLIEDHFVYQRNPLYLIIGGAYGFDPQFKAKARMSISLSKMTFNHELALLVLVEQVYRALTIQYGHPYHND